MPRILSTSLFLGWICLSLCPAISNAANEQRPPNFIVIYCDNLGYGDIGCFGSKLHRTPHIDRLAVEGAKFTSFYVSSGVCTPSRASLMTGCYPRRVNMHVSDTGGSVLRPVSSKGLNPNEITIAEVLKAQGYATTIIGKWHLGDQPEFLPTRQGFDSYFGIPYSDDMTQRPNFPWPPLPLMRDEKVVEAPANRDQLTRRYTEAAVQFIQENKERPFFLYLPHAMPGSTREPFSSEKFRGESANGAWGDSIEEIDWSTGQIMAALKKNHLDKRTLVIWTSDNGAPRRNPPQGSNLPLSGWGYSTREGGMRVPCVMRWPNKIPAGAVCDEVCSTMDLLPTLAKLAGGAAPSDRIIDGRDIGPLMRQEPGAKSPHEAFYFYHVAKLQAVRSGRWKLYLPIGAIKQGSRARPKTDATLYDLVADLQEKNNVFAQHPQVVERLMALAEMARIDLGDANQPGKNQREAGMVNDPKPLLMETP